MDIKKTTLTKRLIDGYEVAKKPLAFIVMLVAVLLQSLPSDLLPSTVRGATYSAVLVVLAIILMQVLFEIYEGVVNFHKKINILGSTKLYEKILEIIINEKKVNIKFIGIAGRHGWNNVLEKLLDENNPDSLIANRTKFEIDVALLDPNTKSLNKRALSRFGSVTSVIDGVNASANYIAEATQQSSVVRLYLYDHMPNILGFLINDNYLFMTYAYWEQVKGELALRGGGTSYFVYDKNDDFGGQEIIRRFNGWFDFIRETQGITTK